MNETRGLLNEMINQVNLKLQEMEKGFYIELNGVILDLVKGNERYCLHIDSNKHEMFKFILYVDDFIYAFVKLNERAILKERVNNMLEIKINDERNMQRALNSLNLFLEKKEQSYSFIIVHNHSTLDLILIKYIDTPSCKGYVEKYILSTETPLRMGAEITKIHTLFLNILM